MNVHSRSFHDRFAMRGRFCHLLVLFVSSELGKEFVQVRASELPLERPGQHLVVRLEVQ